MKHGTIAVVVFLGGVLSGLRAADAPAAPATPPVQTSDLDVNGLLEAGRRLFEEHAPAEIKEQYEFPSREQWDAFAARLQKALSSGSLEELAALEPEAQRALAALRLIPEYGDYADWLSERLDLMEIARKAAETKTQKPAPAPAEEPKPQAGENPRPAEPSETPTGAPVVPYYNLWLERLQNRPKPSRADELIPLLKVIFGSEGVPAELAWLAEVESSLNPAARSPAGARGLFQLMPATARSLGLSLMPLDERAQPGKNARAAAKLLRGLFARFDSWPLALAAYNAGEGRVARALEKKSGSTFADIAETLPAETRMYVPKVLATLAVREKSLPEKLAQPAAVSAVETGR